MPALINLSTNRSIISTLISSTTTATMATIKSFNDFDQFTYNIQDDLLNLNINSENGTIEYMDQVTMNEILNLINKTNKLDSITELILICIFILVIVLGFFGNILVIWTVVFNRHMRTSSNLFTTNLAISDLTLCVFSIPFMTYKALRHTWIFGDFMCRFAPFFQATNVFVSTMSITAIALDRYVNIVYSKKMRTNNKNNKHPKISLLSIICISLIWLFSCAISLPLFIFSRVTQSSMNIDTSIFHHTSSNLTTTTPPIIGAITTTTQTSLRLKRDNFESGYYNNYNKTIFRVNKEQEFMKILVLATPKQHFNLTTTTLQQEQLSYRSTITNLTASNNFQGPIHEHIIHCVENWSRQESRLIYSYISLLIQYIFPIVTVGLAYGRIWWKLKRHRKKLKSYPKQNRSTNEKLDESTILNTDGSSYNNKANGNNGNERTNKAYKSSGTQSKKSKSCDDKRQRKMNILLVFIAIIFAASWLPLNIFNILSDSKLSIIKPNYGYYLINSICILFAMSSAVSNPFLYGFLNENFKREYVVFFNRIKTRLGIFKNNDTNVNDVHNKINANNSSHLLEIKQDKAKSDIFLTADPKRSEVSCSKSCTFIE